MRVMTITLLLAATYLLFKCISIFRLSHDYYSTVNSKKSDDSSSNSWDQHYLVRREAALSKKEEEEFAKYNNNNKLISLPEEIETESLDHRRRIIDISNPPTKEVIKEILLEEQIKLVVPCSQSPSKNYHNSWISSKASIADSSQKQKEVILRLIETAQSSKATIDDYATIYELVYTLIASFTRHDIPILVGFGSHLGARRHHGIIPFGEKDVDLQVFSTDETLVKSIISDTIILSSNNTTEWNKAVTIVEKDFGYSIELFDTCVFYIDFWLFDHTIDRSNNGGDREIQCVGRRQQNLPPDVHPKGGCYEWYNIFHGKNPPIFKESDYFPSLYEIFGTHYVPIPRTSRELETYQYSGSESMGSEHWNMTCGPHRQWSSKKLLGLGTRTVEEWVDIPRELRSCEVLYDVYPFVFKKGEEEDGDEEEELRMGGKIIHQSRLSQSLAT